MKKILINTKICNFHKCTAKEFYTNIFDYQDDYIISYDDNGIMSIDPVINNDPYGMQFYRTITINNFNEIK